MFLEGGASSGKLFPRREERSREQLDGALQSVQTAYLVVCPREVLMRRDTCSDLGAGQKVTITNATQLALSPGFKEKEWSRLI